MAALTPYPSFDCTPDGRAVRWRKYVKRFQTYLTAHEITDDARQKAILLTFGGDELNDIVDSLVPESLVPVGDAETHLQKLIDAVDAHFNPEANIEYQRFMFRRMQQKGDNIDDFYNQLREIAPTCGFLDAQIQQEIKSQLISGCASKKVRQKGLSQPNLTLLQLLTYARTLQLTDSHSKQMTESHVNCMHRGDSDDEAVHKVHTSKQKKHVGKQKQHFPSKSSSKTSSQKCHFCGGSYPHKNGRESCPAFGEKCRFCDKMNHFQDMCMSRSKAEQSSNSKTKSKVHRLRAESDSDCEYVFRAGEQSREGLPRFMIEIGKSRQKLNVLADSGATVNLISEKDFENLSPQPKLEDSQTKIYAYGNKTPIQVRGRFKSYLHAGDATCQATVHVVAGVEGPILSWETCKTLGLLKTGSDAVNSLETDKAQADFPELFTGLGRLNDRTVKLHIDEDVVPVAQRYRRVPFHVRKHVEEQIEKDLKNDVIEKTSGPTPWISPIVVVPKKTEGKVRVCVDMRAANSAIRRERHATPTLDELKTMLSGAKVFSKVDLNQGYNQLELAEESRYITTFATHLGLFRYKRLFFGVNSASEVFQETIRQVVSDLNGVVNISDDILCYGENQEEHDANLRALFKRLRDKGLTLNGEKCEYNKTSLEFLGHVFGGEGIQASQDKIKTILEMPTPKNASEVRSLLGMTNFCGSSFIQDYASLTHDLRQLTKKTTAWSWTQKHTDALNTLKARLSEACTLAFFDPALPTEIYTDASPVGISAVLTQNGKVIQFGSRALTPVEQRYSQTEREALAITWACEHFHIFIFGAPFTVYTDHKPLTAIFNSTRSQLSARIERWVLRMQPYEMNVVYRPGHDNPADYLSRHPVTIKPSSREEKVAEEYLNYVVETSTPKAMTAELVATETAQDATIQAVIKALITNNWYTDEGDKSTFHALFSCRSELSVHDSGILLKGQRIVLPESLQVRAVQIAHTGHQGIVKTAALLREKVWFRNLQSLVEKTVKACHSCQIATPSPAREPLNMSKLPQAPWTEVSADFGQLPNGQYMLVLTDEYSRYPVVDLLHSTSAQAVLPRLEKIFAEFGIPESLKTDNGPPFNSQDFARFADSMGFTHRKITPLWPRANGETERFMRTAKKTVKAAHAVGKCVKRELFRFLLDYRTTPHTTTGVAPATVFFGRVIKNKLPHITHSPHTLDTDIRIRDAAQKRKMKVYADNKCYVKQSDIQVGDHALLRDTSMRKCTPYQPEPFLITGKKGSMVTARRGTQVLSRNSSFFKTVQASLPLQPEEPLEEELQLAEPGQLPGLTPEPDHRPVPAPVVPASDPARVPAPAPDPGPTVHDPPVPLAQPRRSQRTMSKPARFKDYVLASNLY